MRKVRKYRIYAKYRVDVWGWLLSQRKYRGSFKELVKILYVHRQLRGWEKREYMEKFELWKSKKRRKGFGKRRSPYKAYLQEKQKIQYYYGFAKEKQLRQIYYAAKKEKGVLEENLGGVLESRLLTIAYRLGFFESMRVGVQYMIHHGLTVDGRRVKKPNYVLGIGECLDLNQKDLKRLEKWRRWLTGHRTHKKFPFLTGLRKQYKYKTISKSSYIPNYYRRKAGLKKKYHFTDREAKKMLQEQKKGHLWYPPSYLELNALLRKVMLVYRPKPKEIFYPYSVRLGRVVAYFKWW